MPEPIKPSYSFRLVAGLVEGAMAVVAVALGWLLGVAPLESFAWSWGGLVAGGLATVPLLVLVAACARWPLGPLGRLMRVIDERLVPLFRDFSLLDLAALAVLAGLGEELLFRGVIQAAMSGAIGGGTGTLVGLAVAASLFGAAHWITAEYAALAGLIGLYLGAVWLWSGNLLAPMAAHALYDFLVLVYLTRVRVPAP